MQRIVVGVDGSDSAKEALDWALARATPDDVVVLAHAWSLPAVGGFEMPVASLADFEVAAHGLVKDIVAEVETEGGPTIETDVHSGHAGLRLTQLSEDADLVVVGCRGYGGFKGLLLGSVSTYVVHHASCPVAVIRGGKVNADQDSDSD